MKKQVDIEENVNLFNSLIDNMPKVRKDKIKKMMSGHIGQAYFTAPASSKEDLHSCFPGGLLVHSLNVTKIMKKLLDTLCPKRFSNDVISFVGLFHDLGKAGDGLNEYYIPNPSDWHRNKLGKLYELNKDCMSMPISELSLYNLCKNGIDMSAEEYIAIRIHDGPYADHNKEYNMKEPALALVTHWADRWSCLMEKQDNK